MYNQTLRVSMQIGLNQTKLMRGFIDEVCYSSSSKHRKWIIVFICGARQE